MTLEDLMNNAFDETWFCVVTPDGEEHFFWNADYLGGHDETMNELEPLLDRELDEFELVVRDDPEAKDVMNANKVPMVLVCLPKTEEELERDRIEAMNGEGRNMIYWMSDNVRNVLGRHNVSVQGFDQDYLMNAWCIVGMNGTATGIRLGNVRGLSDGEIERRFVAAMLQFALIAEEGGDDEGYELVDELLEAIARKDG